MDLKDLNVQECKLFLTLSKTSKQPRKKYDTSIKMMIVELYLIGNSIQSIAKAFSINVIIIRRWIKEHGELDIPKFLVEGRQNQKTMRMEIQKLKTVLHEAEMENSILLKIINIFPDNKNKYPSSS